MNIIRVRSTEILKHITPHLTFTDPDYKAPFIDELILAMMNNPDRMMVLANLEDEKVSAFLVAENPGFRSPFVRILQAWNNSNGPKYLGEEFMGILVVWAKILGKTHILAETTRDTGALYRRYQFKPMSVMVRLNLDNNGLQELLPESLREISDV